MNSSTIVRVVALTRLMLIVAVAQDVAGESAKRLAITNPLHYDAKLVGDEK